MSVRLDHVYVSVKDMDRAIKFYEDLFEMKVSHREENTWADFDNGNGFYFGLINPKCVGNKRLEGNNEIVVLWADNVDDAFKKIKKWGCKNIDEPTNLDYTDYPYRCFQFYDTENNLIEIANYNRK